MAAFSKSRCFSVFFFQAEDGIRDLTVTGVQTCALPIYSILTDGQNFYMYLDPRSNKFGFIPWDLDAAWGNFWIASRAEQERASIWHPWIRSEERRVGKECRSRWSPYH